MNSRQLREQLDAIERSTSWKITAPLRVVGRLLKPGQRRNMSAKRIVLGVLRRMAAQPRLRHLGVAVLSRFPKIQRRIRQLLIGGRHSQLPYGASGSVFAGEETKISPKAKTILRRLRVMIDINDR